MVELLKNNFNGQPNGTATAANSAASGDPFSHVVLEGGGTVNYLDSAIVATPGTTGATHDRHTIAASHGRVCVSRRSFNYPGVLTSLRQLMDHRTSLLTSAVIGAVQQRGNQPQIEATWGNGLGLPDSRYTFPAVGTYWTELVTICSSVEGASDGQIALRVYAANGTTLLHEWISPANLALTHSRPNSVRYHHSNTAGGLTVDNMDDVQAMFTDTDAPTWLGPYDSNRMLPAPDNVTIEQITAPGPANNNGTIRVSWDESTDAAHYDIAWAAGENATSGFVTVGTVARGTADYLVTGRPAGPYTIAVRARP